MKVDFQDLEKRGGQIPLPKRHLSYTIVLIIEFCLMGILLYTCMCYGVQIFVLYTVYGIQSHLLFKIMQCHNYLL